MEEDKIRQLEQIYHNDPIFKVKFEKNEVSSLPSSEVLSFNAP